MEVNKNALLHQIDCEPPERMEWDACCNFLRCLRFQLLSRRKKIRPSSLLRASQRVICCTSWTTALPPNTRFVQTPHSPGSLDFPAAFYKADEAGDFSGRPQNPIFQLLRKQHAGLKSIRLPRLIYQLPDPGLSDVLLTIFVGRLQQQNTDVFKHTRKSLCQLPQHFLRASGLPPLTSGAFLGATISSY